MQRIEKTVAEFVVRGPALTLPPDATVAEAAKLMASRHSGCVLVESGGKVAGIFTERDFVLRVAALGLDPTQTQVSDVMTPDPETLGPANSITYAVNKMAVGGFRHVPILDRGRPVAVLAVRHVVEHLADIFEGSLPDDYDDEVTGQWVDIGGG